MSVTKKNKWMVITQHNSSRSFYILQFDIQKVDVEKLVLRNYYTNYIYFVSPDGFFFFSSIPQVDAPLMNVIMKSLAFTFISLHVTCRTEDPLDA